MSTASFKSPASRKNSLDSRAFATALGAMFALVVTLLMFDGADPYAELLAGSAQPKAASVVVEAGAAAPRL